MKLETAATPRDFEIRNREDREDPAHVQVLGVRQLTLREQKLCHDELCALARARVREEYTALAKTMTAADSTKFLLQCIRANAVADPAHVQELADSVVGIVTVLKLATGKTGSELERLIEQDLENMDLCRYHALGLDVDAMLAAMAKADSADSAETETKSQGENKPADTFPAPAPAPVKA